MTTPRYLIVALIGWYVLGYLATQLVPPEPNPPGWTDGPQMSLTEAGSRLLPVVAVPSLLLLLLVARWRRLPEVRLLAGVLLMLPAFVMLLTGGPEFLVFAPIELGYVIWVMPTTQLRPVRRRQQKERVG